MMRAHGFTARTAMGWLRLMRPGSVIGRQQHFLCRVQRIREEQAAARSAGQALPRAASSPSLRGASLRDEPAAVGAWQAPIAHDPSQAAAAAAAAGQVSSALDRQGAARMRAGRAARLPSAHC
jgi:hypothetical protein